MRTLTVLLCVTLSAAGCASSNSTRALQATYVATQVADVHSTELALRRCPTCAEGNPLVPNSLVGRVLMKGAMTTGIVWLTSGLEHQGYKSHARWTLALATALTAAIASNNYRLSVSW